jgi:hypothetical protein
LENGNRDAGRGEIYNATLAFNETRVINVRVRKNIEQQNEQKQK